MRAIKSLDEARPIGNAIRDRLESADPGLLERYPVAEYVRFFDEAASSFGYRHVPEPALQWAAEIESRAGAAVLEDYHRLLLVTLIEHRDRRTCPLRMPRSISVLLEDSYLRMLSQLETVEEGFFRFSNDLFAKDLGLCRLKLLPCGAEHMEIARGVPRSTLLRGGLGQLLRGLRFFVAGRRGFRHWIEGHWDRRLFRQFNQRGYDDCYLRVAELLDLNPAVAGMMSASWWLDPALEEVSPDLTFLRRVPVASGAALFRVGEDEVSTRDAVRFSRERQAAMKAGAYRPAAYLLAWSRDDLMRWARAQASRGLSESSGPVTSRG